MVFDAFIGPSYISPAVAWDAQRAVNLYLEADESGAGKSPKALLGTPGLIDFETLPTSPVRGIWTGLIDNLPGSTGTDLCYVVAGSKFYQVLSGGTYSLLGDVTDDAGHSPVTFNVNGGQIFITSAGIGWIWDGTTLGRAYFNNGLGTVNTVGAAVTWTSGDPFDSTLVPGGIVINSVSYGILAFVDQTHITLTGAGAGTQSGVAYRIMGGSAIVNTNSFNEVNWVSGDRFTGLQVGDDIALEGRIYTIAFWYTDEFIGVTGGFLSNRFNQRMAHSAPVRAAMGAYLDGYFAALPPNSKSFYISSPGDGKKWNPIDFGRKQGFPDNIASFLADHEDLWLFGSETTEVWRNTGNADFPLQRDPGAFIAQGIRAPFSAVSLANGVAWIGGDARGNPVAWRATGYQPGRVSTHGVETAWAGYSTITDATGFVYVVRGHQFWVISFPTANATWVYDATSGQWHERGWWNGATNDRVRYATHGYVFGKHLVGDWSSGKLYELSEAAFDDAGTAIHRYRTAPHLSNEELWTFYSQFKLACMAGLSPTLSWSDDLGVSWHAEVAATARYIGGVSQNSIWKRLGKARDRVWRVTVTTAAQVALIAAYLEIEAGSA